MSLLLAAQNRDMQPFKSAINNIDPNIDVDIWPAIPDPARVQFAVAWNHPKHIFGKFPNLNVISSLGAGVDHLLKDDTIPVHIKFTRAVTPSLADQMSDYILTAVLNIFRKTEFYLHQQKQGKWNAEQQYQKKELAIGLMGLGELGSYAANRLYQNGFVVHGWSRSKKEIEGITSFAEHEREDFLNRTNMLINLLPLTNQTEGILDLELFKQLKQPAFLINVARGEHLVEEDLIYALDTHLIKHAILDVFATEPLPGSHPFWGREKITITPHVASITNPDEVAGLLVENYKRNLSGMSLLYEVDKIRGY